MYLCLALFFLGFISGWNNPTDSVSKAAQKFDQAKDYFYNKIKVVDKNITIISYFDLSKHTSEVQKTLTPNNDGHYDLRNFETIYCRMARATQPLFVKHRGKIGLLTGITLAMIFYEDIKKLKAWTMSKI